MAGHRAVYACDQCDERFTRRADLKTNIEHEHALMLLYNQCEETFTSSSDLKTHLGNHRTSCEWNCNGCSFQAYIQQLT